jgi:hypothetical protein
MGQKLRARLERLFRPSHYVPEGADTTGERWDLPYGGPGLIIPGASARPSAVAAELADDAIDRDWDELLSWAHAAPPERMPAGATEPLPVIPAISLPVLPVERMAALPAQVVLGPQDAPQDAGGEAEEWAAALARAKSAAPVPAPRPRVAMAAAVVPPPPLRVLAWKAAPATELDEDAEWAACLARAKALTSTPAAAVNEDDEWEWALSLARAKAQASAPAAAEADEWATSISRAKARSEAKREQTKQRDEAEWRTSIARAKSRSARAFG